MEPQKAGGGGCGGVAGETAGAAANTPLPLQEKLHYMIRNSRKSPASELHEAVCKVCELAAEAEFPWSRGVG